MRTTAVDLDDTRASLEVALSVVGDFEIDASEAHRIAGEAGKAVSTWRRVAKELGLRPAEIGRMASAFEHDDLAAALRLAS